MRDISTDEAGASYVVVDTGPWILGKKVVLPAGMVERVDHDEECVYVSRTKEQIKNAPPFSRDSETRDAGYLDGVGRYYAGLDLSEPPAV